MFAGDKTQSQGLSREDRQIRVFISSTFRDMQEGWVWLIKTIYAFFFFRAPPCMNEPALIKDEQEQDAIVEERPRNQGGMP
ncbi:MAG: hypothetical protein NT105_16410 [Verrucomicrobia bacterium]|nr:hypothetical protein [Verrucomicrobiota bacterium]